MPNIAGIDPSITRTAVFVINESGQFVSRRCFTSPSFGQDIEGRVSRNQAVGRQIREFLVPLQPVMIAFENYAFGSNQRGHHANIEHGYQIRNSVCLLTPRPKFIEVPPSTLKKHCTGMGKAEKAAMVSKLAKRFPDLEFEFDDEADAAALALFGLQAAGLAEPANDIQRASLAAVMDPKAKKPKKKREAAF